MNTPLNTANLRNPGKIQSLDHLHALVSQGNHVPLWVHKNLASQILAAHGHNNAAVAHPGVPIPLPPAQVEPPQQNQQPQRLAMGGMVRNQPSLIGGTPGPTTISPLGFGNADTGYPNPPPQAPGGQPGFVPTKPPMPPPHPMPFTPPSGLVGGQQGNAIHPPPQFLGPPITGTGAPGQQMIDPGAVGTQLGGGGNGLGNLRIGNRRG